MAKKTLEKKADRVYSHADATPEEKAAHAARRRVLAAILGWSEKSKAVARPVPMVGELGEHYSNRLYNYAKAIACQSFGMKSEQWQGAFGSTNERELNRLFNSIPTQRLRNIYATFCNKEKDEENANKVAQSYTTEPN